MLRAVARPRAPGPGRELPEVPPEQGLASAEEDHGRANRSELVDEPEGLGCRQLAGCRSIRAGAEVTVHAREVAAGREVPEDDRPAVSVSGAGDGPTHGLAAVHQPADADHRSDLDPATATGRIRAAGTRLNSRPLTRTTKSSIPLSAESAARCRHNDRSSG